MFISKIIAIENKKRTEEPILRILLVDDDVSLTSKDKEHLGWLEQLLPANFKIVKHLTTYDQAKKELLLHAEDYEICLLDYSLEENRKVYLGTDLLREVDAKHLDLPILLLTVTKKKTLAKKALELGAESYLVKDHIDDVMLESAITYTLARKKLEKTKHLAKLGEHAAKIAHDIRNLFAPILGNIQILLHENLEEENLILLRAAEAAVQKANIYLQNILDYSKARILNKKKASLQRILADTYNELIKKMTKNSDVVLNIADDLWPVEVDEDKFEQVILNMVTNADQAMKKKDDANIIMIKGKNISISEHDAVKADPGRYVEIIVQDNGPGIPKTVLSKIFEPFFTTKKRGTGLGLAACAQIIEDHGGYIDVTSKKNAGAKFFIYLPAAGVKE